MNIVNVFLGSSFKLMYARKRVGNLIRKLNDKWMERGVRVCLKIWEDFRTEYEDKSKQDEYIEELVLPSHICVFMYDDCINPYTEKELNAKIAQDVSHIYVLHIPQKEGQWHEARDVESKLRSKQLTAIDVKDIKQIDEIIVNLVDKYIKSKGLEDDDKVEMNQKTFYTTIPLDLQMEEDEFEDTIRVVDDLSQEFLHTRCVLYPKRQLNLLDKTDHYIPLMKREASDDDLKEFQHALKLQHDSVRNAPVITLFTKGAIFKKNAKVENLLTGRDLFSVSVRSYDTVKWRLMLWLLHQQTGFMPSSTMQELRFKSRYLYIYNKPIISLSNVDESRSAEKIEQDLAAKRIELSQLIGLTDNKSISKYNQIEAEKDFLEKKLLLTMIRVINGWIFEEVHFNEDEAADMSIHEFEQKAELQGLMLDNAIQMANDAAINLKKTFKELDDVEKKMLGDLLACDKSQAIHAATKIKEIRLKKESILRIMAKSRIVNPVSLLSNQLYTMAVFDTYLKGNAQPKEEDDLYLRMLKDSDDFGYKSPQIEMARLNYGNALNRKNDLKGAYLYYTTAIENLRHFTDESQNIREIKTHVYISAIQSLASVNLRNKEIHILIDELKALIANWKESKYDTTILEGAFWATWLRTVISDFKSSRYIAEDAYGAFMNLDSNQSKPVEDEHYHDAFCYLPIVIAGYYIDRIEEWNYIQNSNQLYTRCIDLCNRAINNAKKQTDTDNVMSMEMQGRAYHQLGFLYAHSQNIGSWIVAARNYLKAYEIREWLSEVTNDASDKASLAETSVNYGALYLQLGQAQLSKHIVVKLENGSDADIYAIAMHYAQKAVDIYSELMRKEEEESELCYYKAVQLKGSIIYFYGKEKHTNANLYEGITLLKEAYDWHKEHPQNTYRDTFEGVAGQILKNEGLIK